MKKTLLIFSFFISLQITLNAQLVYYNADQFSLLGKATNKTETRYERLPASIKETTRKPLWDLGKNTAGLSIRFSSNTTSVGIKWTLLNGTSMNHMTDTGIKGFDLYCLEGDEWVYVNSGRPTPSGKEHKSTIISNMEPKEREFILNFPLYDGVVDLQIGVDSLASISDNKIGLPSRKMPIVAYGTSLLQGGCATRPGMAHTNILTRWLNREFINLGFSGNGQLDYEIAELMTEVDASMYILDFMPNVTSQQIEEKMERFYSIIRAKAPNTPILFVENPIFPQATYDLAMRNALVEKNATMNKIIDRLKKKDKNITVISSQGIIGFDNEATVDGIHYTDLGFLRYAEYLLPILKSILVK